MTSPGFVAVYRWHVSPELSLAFEQWWRDGTDALKQSGSFGSTLGQDDDGAYIGIAVWPDDQTRRRAFAERADTSPAPGVIRFEELTAGKILDLRWSI
jgi:hypothetical protein